MMVNSLLLESYESRLQHRRAFLQHGIYNAYMQHFHGQSTSRTPSSPITPGPTQSMTSSTTSATPSETTSSSELLSMVQPMLIYTGLIEQLQQFFKLKKPTGATSKATEGSNTTCKQQTETEDDSANSLKEWEVVMKERLLNVREMVGFSKELLSWLDDMTSAVDLQEAFDIIGVLADVLSGGVASCEEFVHAAIKMGKS